MPHIESVEALASLSLTHVQFNAQDPIAYVFAYITLAPIAIMVFYASVAVSRREVVSILMLLGQLANELVNVLLKEYFQISRPNDYLGSGYGMPSSHSQFVWYFTTFGTLYLVNQIKFKSFLWKWASVIAMMAMSLLVCHSRIYLGYHTLGQVTIGSLVGVVFGLIWYSAMEMVRTMGWIDILLDSSLAQWLLLRDMRNIDNVLEWEYQNWVKWQASVSKGKTSKSD